MLKRMKSTMAALTILALLIGLLQGGGKAEAADFTDLDQAGITKVMGLGWNLGNQLEAVTDGVPKETNWGNPVVTEELIKAVKAAGFQSVRIPVSYFTKIGKAPNYKVDMKWLDRIQEIVDYCVNNDLYTIINMHGDGFQTIDGSWLHCDAKDQKVIEAKYAAVWKQVAARFKDYDEHLIFESMNEVSDMKYAKPVAEYYDNINVYNQLFIDTVRKTGGNNAMRWVLIPGWNTDIEYTAGDYGFKIPADQYLSDRVPKGENRIMISVHYYAPWDFCGGESGEITQWGEDAVDSKKTSTHSGQSFMASQFKLLKSKFTSKGYPVVIGEFGAIDKTQDDPQNAYYREQFVYKLCENSVKQGCIPMYWDNGYNTKYGFGLFDRKDCKATQQGIIDAMLSTFNPSADNGTSTGIILNKTSLSMEIGDAGLSLTATLAPADSTDKIIWSSSDETVATVSSSGIVRPQTIGTAMITAAANGHKAVCKVSIKKSTHVKVMLYAIETSAWSTIQSEEAADISRDGGTYTLRLKGSKSVLSNIGSLYLKDVQVQSAVSKTSIFKSAKIKINSVKFNGAACTSKVKGTDEIINQDSGALDYALLNQWVKDSEKIKEVKKGKNDSYYFTKTDYTDDNTIEITFTISDVVLK